MQIKQIQIKNFRGIEDSVLKFDGYNVLIGRNGAGKSSFLKALEFFYTPSFKVGLNDFFHQDISRPIEVSITFDFLSAEASAEFSSYIQNGLLIVTKKAVWNDASGNETYHGSRMQCPDFEDIRQLSGREKINKYKELIKSEQYKELNTANSQAEVDLQLAEWEKGHAGNCKLMIDDGKFFGFKGVGTGKLDKYSDLVFIPAVRDASEDASESANSALKKLLDVAVRRAMHTTSLVSKFKEEIITQYKALLDNDAFCLDGIGMHMNSALKRYAPRAGLNLSWQQIPDPRISEPSAIAKLIEDGMEGDIAFKGHGLQRAYVMSILHFLAEIQSGIIELKEEKTSSLKPGLVLAIEEPELYQHPSQARFLANTLVEMTKPYESKPPVQICCTSHSPYFVDVQTFNKIKVVRKAILEQAVENKEKPKLKTVLTATTLDAVAEKLTLAHQPLEPYSGSALKARLITLLNPYINEAFFSDFVIIVEGEEDRAILLGALSFFEEARLLEEKGVSIVPVNGKTNIDKLKAILDLFSIPNYVMFDRDGENRKNDQGNMKTNIAIQKLIGVDDPQPSPAQIIAKDYAIFEPDFRRAIRKEVGESLWDNYRNEIGEELGYDNPSKADKNPIAIKLLFEKLRANKKDIPVSLKNCLAFIIAKVQEINL